MRYAVKQYAAALLESVRKNPKAERRLAGNFVSLLKRKGDFKKIGLILAAAEKIFLRRRGFRKVVWETSDFSDGKTAERIKAALGGKIFLRRKIAPELLGGAKIFLDDEILIDASLKRRLDELFPRKAAAGSAGADKKI